MEHVEHKIIEGQGAGKWLPFARTKVVALHARAKAQRVNALIQRWTVEGGDVEIAVRVVGDQRYIHIRRKSCPPFLSGVCDLVLQPVGDGTVTPVYQVPNPNPPPATVPTFRRFFPSPAQTEPPRAWRDEPRLAQDETAAKQMVKLKGSMFTGEMRKVVQMLQGTGVFIPYSPTYAVTHGVFKAANGQRWVIEISSQGVVAWVMEVCRNPVLDVDSQVVLDYTPFSTPKPLDINAAKAAGTFIELMPASAVLDAYTKGPFFFHCGWAFDATGHRAANVCQRGEDQNTIRSYLYRIDIQEVDNLPAGASLVEVDSGWLLGPITNHMKYPTSEYNKLFSFRLDYRIDNDRISNGPVYCYYDGDTLLVAKYFHDASSGSVSSINTIPACESINTVGVFEDSLRTTSPTQGFSIGSYATPTTGFSNSITERLELGEKQHVGALIESVLPVTWRRLNISAWSRSIGASESIGYRSVMIVPLFDREALYYALETHSVSFTPDLRAVQRPCLNPDIYSTVLITDCDEIMGVDRVVLLTGNIATPGSLCDGAPVAGCQGEVTPCGFTVDFGAQSYMGPDTGSEVITRVANDSCNSASIPPFMPAIKQCVFNLSSDSTNYQFEYHASGGISRSLGQPISPDRLFGPIEENEFQLMQSIRDAFDARRYMISPDVAGEVDWLFSSLSAYPTSEFGLTLAFVGVP